MKKKRERKSVKIERYKIYNNFGAKLIAS